jgi:hypothetical protein
MPMEMDTTDLIARARAGDHNAFRDLESGTKRGRLRRERDRVRRPAVSSVPWGEPRELSLNPPDKFGCFRRVNVKGAL